MTAPNGAASAGLPSIDLGGGPNSPTGAYKPPTLDAPISNMGMPIEQTSPKDDYRLSDMVAPRHKVKKEPEGKHRVVHAAADTTYLTTSLSVDERKKILSGDRHALERGKKFGENLDYFINQISFLHFNLGVSPLQIAQFFLLGEENEPNYELEKQELINYVEEVILKKNHNRN